VSRHLSAEKRTRQNTRRRTRNKAAKARIRTITKQLVTASDDEAKARLFTRAQSELDSAAGKGVIPRKRAARKKSRLAAALHSKNAPPSP
jgi:small subunit ribosomal protein S20